MTEGLRTLQETLVGPFFDPTQRLYVPFLLATVAIGLVWHGLTHADRDASLSTRLRQLTAPHTWNTPSSRLDLQLFVFRRLLVAMQAMPTFGGGTALAFWLSTSLTRAFGHTPLAATPSWAVVGLYTLTLFVVWDFSRYVVHRLMHEVPVLWGFHQVHHSAEVLTPLTFYRVHPVEGVFYALRGALVTGGLAGGFFWAFGAEATQLTLLGVNALALVLTATTGNLRHSEAWLGFPPSVERWLISPAQHQLHHGREEAQQRTNYGTWLAIWDRLGGTLALSSETERPPTGLADEDRNHRPDDLISALTGPFMGWRPRHTTAAFLLGLWGLGTAAEAQEAGSEQATAGDTTEDTEAAEDDDAAYEIEVVADTESLRIAGSAHTVSQEELERFEYDDIHRVLSKVPGVYLRDEDGFGLRPNIGIRGANSDRSAKVTLMEDGILSGPAPYAAPAAYYFPMTTRMVQVDVFKGPAAIQYGPHTVGGAVDMRTRDVPDRPDGALDVAVGMRRALKLHGWGGAGGPRWGVMLEGVHLAHGGFKQLDDGGPTGFDKSEFMLKTAVRTDPERTTRHEVQLKAGYSRERSHETYLGLTDDDFEATPFRRYASSSEALMQWRRTAAELTWTAQFGQHTDLKVVAYHHWFQRSWTKLNRFSGGPSLHALLLNPDAGQAAVYAAVLRGEEDSVGSDQNLMIGTNARTFHSGGAAAIARHRVSTDLINYQGEVGLRVHADEVRRLHDEAPFAMTSGRVVPVSPDTDPEIITENHGRALAIAAHTRHDLLVGPVRVLPGLRVEAVRTAFTDTLAGTETSTWRVIPLPGVGLHVQPIDWLGVFAGVHRGFSPVAPGQDPATLPESSWNAEAGTRIAWRGFSGELVGFFNPYTNLTGQCTFSGGCSDAQIDQQFNGGRVHVYGLEAGIGQHIGITPTWSLDGHLTYSWTRSSFRTGFVSGFPQFGTVEIGDQLPYLPEHQGAATLTLNHPVGSLALSVNARSAMRDIAGQGVMVNEERVDAMATLDIAADFRISRFITAYTTVTNATNAVYQVARRPFGLRPGMPIQAMFGVKLHPVPRSRD